MDIKLMPDKYYKKSKKVHLFKDGLSIDTKQLLISSVLLLTVVVLICFGLWGYKIYLEQDIENVIKETEDLQSQRNLELEASFSKLKIEIEDFKKILQIHVYPSKIFTILEELTIPQVQFISFNADLAISKLILETEAIDYNTLAKQIVVFEEDWRIKKVDLFEVSLGISGKIKSNLEIEIDPDFLRSE